MTMAGPKIDWKWNLPSFIATGVASGIGCAVAFAALQGEVKALIGRVDDYKTRIERLEAGRQTDREALIVMQGDIRVIRHILETSRPPPR